MRDEERRRVLRKGVDARRSKVVVRSAADSKSGSEHINSDPPGG